MSLSEHQGAGPNGHDQRIAANTALPQQHNGRVSATSQAASRTVSKIVGVPQSNAAALLPYAQVLQLVHPQGWRIATEHHSMQLQPQTLTEVSHRNKDAEAQQSLAKATGSTRVPSAGVLVPHPVRPTFASIAAVAQHVEQGIRQSAAEQSDGGAGTQPGRQPKTQLTMYHHRRADYQQIAERLPSPGRDYPPATIMVHTAPPPPQKAARAGDFDAPLPYKTKLPTRPTPQAAGWASPDRSHLSYATMPPRPAHLAPRPNTVQPPPRAAASEGAVQGVTAQTVLGKYGFKREQDGQTVYTGNEECSGVMLLLAACEMLDSFNGNTGQEDSFGTSPPISYATVTTRRVPQRRGVSQRDSRYNAAGPQQTGSFNSHGETNNSSKYDRSPAAPANSFLTGDTGTVETCEDDDDGEEGSDGSAPIPNLWIGKRVVKRKITSALVGPCCHCGVTVSPQWRKGPKNKPMLCNACGIRYLRTRSLTRASNRKPAGAALGKRGLATPEKMGPPVKRPLPSPLGASMYAASECRSSAPEPSPSYGTTAMHGGQHLSNHPGRRPDGAQGPRAARALAFIRQVILPHPLHGAMVPRRPRSAGMALSQPANHAAVDAVNSTASDRGVETAGGVVRMGPPHAAGFTITVPHGAPVSLAPARAMQSAMHQYEAWPVRIASAFEQGPHQVARVEQAMAVRPVSPMAAEGTPPGSSGSPQLSPHAIPVCPLERSSTNASPVLKGAGGPSRLPSTSLNLLQLQLSLHQAAQQQVAEEQDCDEGGDEYNMAIDTEKLEPQVEQHEQGKEVFAHDDAVRSHYDKVGRKGWLRPPVYPSERSILGGAPETSSHAAVVMGTGVHGTVCRHHETNATMVRSGESCRVPATTAAATAKLCAGAPACKATAGADEQCGQGLPTTTGNEHMLWAPAVAPKSAANSAMPAQVGTASAAAMQPVQGSQAHSNAMALHGEAVATVVAHAGAVMLPSADHQCHL